ncbi:WAT1-related protein At3g18200-like [Miscanthus floridulus]|uniref:WAT1-related protein At3g18200-like n=1 Tax=Miscanthus floridulus TaxID=154761 RepID=UPI00345B0DB0
MVKAVVAAELLMQCREVIVAARPFAACGGRGGRQDDDGDAVQLWCTQKKGPVFVTMFDPLQAIMAAMLAYFMFGENLYIGSIIGGAVVILGLYMLLWGKGKDQIDKSSTEHEPERDGDQSEASYAVQ